MRLPDGLDLVLDGEAAPIDDPAILDAVGALIRQSGWPVELTAGGFTAPFGPQAAARRLAALPLRLPHGDRARRRRRHPLALRPLTGCPHTARTRIRSAAWPGSRPGSGPTDARRHGSCGKAK